MEFEWDDAKAASNFAKHGVSFEIVYEFEWDGAVIRPDQRVDYGEERFRAIGRVEGDVFYTIVFTPRRDRMRVISSRRANRKEVLTWQGERET